MRKAIFNPFHKQRGATLLEVMISVMVLSIGLLGIAGLQSSTLRNTLSAQQRTAAITMATAMAERIRAYYLVNRHDPALSFTEFNLAKTCETAPRGTGLVKDAQKQLYADLIATFSQSASSCIQIDYVAATKSIRVSVTWDDSRAGGGATAETVKYEVKVQP
jgi:type IV pilus assembly protein PilV